MVADLLVVGLDLATGLEVHAGDRETQEWWNKGHNGDQTLVCLACYQGADLPGGPRVVALVPEAGSAVPVAATSRVRPGWPRRGPAQPGEPGPLGR